MEYRVTWEIDVDADSPEDAAIQAYNLIAEPESTTTIFEVYKGKKLLGSFDVTELAK